MRTRFNKHKYLRVIKFNTDKSMETTYHISATYNPPFAIDPNHVFNWKGYRTVIISNISAQTINPLDFTSKYDANHFRVAVESKLISDTFTSLKPKIDTTTILLIVNIFFSLAVIYLIMKGQGAI